MGFWEKSEGIIQGDMVKLKNNLFCIGCLFFFIFRVSAQEVTVQGTFHADRVKIGDVIPFSLTATHSSDKILIFPDSSFSFKPFEFEERKYFPTRTQGR